MAGRSPLGIGFLLFFASLVDCHALSFVISWGRATCRSLAACWPLTLKEPMNMTLEKMAEVIEVKAVKVARSLVFARTQPDGSGVEYLRGALRTLLDLMGSGDKPDLHWHLYSIYRDGDGDGWASTSAEMANAGLFRH